MNILKKLKQSYIHWWHLPIGEKYAGLLVIIAIVATIVDRKITALMITATARI